MIWRGGVLRLGRNDARYPSSLATLGGAAPPELAVRGDPTVLGGPLVGLFCSARLPPAALSATYDLAAGLREAGVGVVSGFQSFGERECLRFLLRGQQPVVVCPARGLEGMQVPVAWWSAGEEGRLVLVSAVPERVRRATARVAEVRNGLVLALAGTVVVIHATPGGRLARVAGAALGAGRRVFCLDLPENEDLRVAGAVARGAAALVEELRSGS